jgi:hypothetical protein
MINFNQYKIIIPLKTKKEVTVFSFNTKLERDKFLLGPAGEDVISLMDIELVYDNNYNLVESNTSTHKLK